ncbi:MAG: FeoA family protein [Coriobacteriales bacterium]|nr:FeoA family protein [Coriobacteriales bacterium]
MPITLLEAGGTGTITRIGGADSVRARLNGLGFIEGTQLEVVAKTAGGLIVNVRGSRIALGMDLASRVYI